MNELENYNIDNFKFEQEGRHHQLPNLEKLKKNKKDEIIMIKDFFTEYKKWAKIMHKISNGLD